LIFKGVNVVVVVVEAAARLPPDTGVSAFDRLPHSSLSVSELFCLYAV